MTYNDQYSDVFYSDRSAGASKSAAVVLSRLFSIYRPESIVDFGCGDGNWLLEAENLGVESLIGIDGPWVDEGYFADSEITFMSADFEKGVMVKEAYGLAICLEVAEHLNADACSKLIDTLVQASDIVLFSGAIIEQGGVNHINEQDISDWVNHFEVRDYVALDVIRPATWFNDEVDSWYRQNVLVFINKRNEALIRRFKSHERKLCFSIEDTVIHPALYLARAKELAKVKSELNSVWENQYLPLKHSTENPSVLFIMLICYRCVRNWYRDFMARLPKRL